jgi:hypothetical protein
LIQANELHIRNMTHLVQKRYYILLIKNILLGNPGESQNIIKIEQIPFLFKKVIPVFVN